MPHRPMKAREDMMNGSEARSAGSLPQATATAIATTAVQIQAGMLPMLSGIHQRRTAASATAKSTANATQSFFPMLLARSPTGPSVFSIAYMTLEEDRAESQEAHGKGQGPEEREKAPGEFHPVIQRNAQDDVSQCNTEQERRKKAADGKRPFPETAALLIERPEFERNRPENQGEQDEHQGQVKTAENRRIDMGKRGEEGAAGGQEPYFIAVPYRPDGGKQGRRFLFLFREKGKE